MSINANEKIAKLEMEIEQRQNRIKSLRQQHKEQERKARTKRLCKRMGLFESMLPETVQLTDEQYQSFLEKTVANDFGRRMLAALAPQGGKNTTPQSLVAPQSDFAHAPSGMGGGNSVGVSNAAESAAEMGV